MKGFFPKFSENWKVVDGRHFYESSSVSKNRRVKTYVSASFCDFFKYFFTKINHEQHKEELAFDKEVIPWIVQDRLIQPQNVAGRRISSGGNFSGLSFFLNDITE